MADRLDDCSGIRTKREAARELFRWPSTRLLGAALGATAALRAVVGGRPTPWDATGAVVVLAAGPFFEWYAHRDLLHAPGAKQIGPFAVETGAGHAVHHLRPTETEWILLGREGAQLFATAAVVIVAGATAPAVALAGAPVAGPTLSAAGIALVKVLEYEWAHFLFHCRYRCRSRRYRRLEANHRLHHFRNEDFWLGVTSNLADRVLGTLPASKGDVPLSPTARTLGVTPAEAA